MKVLSPRKQRKPSRENLVTTDLSPEPVAALLQLADQYWFQAWNEGRKGRPLAEASREARLAIREQIETRLDALAYPDLQVPDTPTSD